MTARNQTPFSSSSTPSRSTTPQHESDSMRTQEVSSQRHANETEHEPLLYSPDSAEASDGAQSGVEAEQDLQSKSVWYLMLLTISIGGLQIAWSVELASVSPFLLSLRISKAVMALVWIAGPLGGALVQPYVGIQSDNCRLRWGRRRPFIVVGAIATGISLMLLSWTRQIVTGFLSIFGVDSSSNGAMIAQQIFAVVLVYVLDFVINVIQAGIRALIVDSAPTHQQEDANAWALRFTGIGSIVGYSLGNLDLPRIFPFLGETQFQVLCALTCIGFILTVSLTCLTIAERDPRLYGEPTNTGGVLSFFKNLYLSVKRLPQQVQRVCIVQIFAWIGWFPILFYLSTYIGGLYAESFLIDDPDMTEEEINEVWDRGTRVGSYGLLIFAITTFAASIVLPLVIAPSHAAPETTHGTKLRATTPNPSAPSRHDETKSQSSTSSLRRGRLPSIRIQYLTIRRLWMFSHLLFAVLMWCTFFVYNVTSAIVLVAFIGIPWAVTNWAPFALIANEISKRDVLKHRSKSQILQSGHDDADTEEVADQAGVVLGIHNVSIAAPQVIATLVSSGIFRALQKPRGEAGDQSVAWVFRFGGVCAVLAACACQYVAEERDSRAGLDDADGERGT